MQRICKERVIKTAPEPPYSLLLADPIAILFQFARIFFFPSIIPHLSLDSRITIFTLALVCVSCLLADLAQSIL